MKVYKVMATYAKGLKPTDYYVTANSPSEAKKIFINRFSWLDVIESVSVVDDETADKVLNSPERYILIRYCYKEK